MEYNQILFGEDDGDVLTVIELIFMLGFYFYFILAMKVWSMAVYLILNKLLNV